MELFYYVGKNLSGEKINGTFKAKDKGYVAKKIKDQGYIPVKIEKININSFSYMFKAHLYRVNPIDIAIFCEQLSVMLDAGIDTIECLNVIKEQTENGRLRDAIFSMIKDIKHGYTLTEACNNIPFLFTEVLVNMIEAGEISDRLSDVLKILSTYYQDMAKQQEKIKNTLVYPCILGVASFFVVFFLITNVLPVYVNLFSIAGTELPTSTKILLTISSHFFKILAAGFVLLIILITLIPKIFESNKAILTIDAVKLDMPFIGRIIQKGYSAKIARILFVLISSGIPLLKALKIAGGTINNALIKTELTKIQLGLEKGKNLSEIMSKKVFPPILIKIITTGEESGNLEEMLKKAAYFYENEVDILQERLNSFIEPTIIIFLTLIIAFIIISIMMPLFEIYNFY